MQFNNIQNWNPPKHWQRITTIDAHTEGEPLRIIFQGFPKIEGKTILKRRRFARENFDHLRTALMWEPRGHSDMYGCIVTPPVSPDADFGVLFFHNEGYSTMCGHGIIAVTKVSIETGLVSITRPETIIKIDTPAGMVTSVARIANNRVESIYFNNVPSFVLQLDAEIDVPEIGGVRYDLAFGGAFYAFVEAGDIGLNCTAENSGQLIETGMRIKKAISENQEIVHPFEEELNFLYGTIFTGPPVEDNADSRNVCIFANGEVDRSPTGTGVSARMAIHFARGEITVGEKMIIESIIGSRFAACVAEKTTLGPYEAVIPQVEGRAFITGKHEFFLDPDDPLKNGFLLR
jgi:trans-L-3-hydroxyproline dehydratase